MYQFLVNIQKTFSSSWDLEKFQQDPTNLALIFCFDPYQFMKLNTISYNFLDCLWLTELSTTNNSTIKLPIR